MTSQTPGSGDFGPVDWAERPELTTVIPNDPRVPQLPQGNCIVSVKDHGLWIEHADPKVVISVQLLDLIRTGPADGVTLTFAAGHSRELGPCYEGAVLRIEAVNRTVIYRITEWLPWYLGCLAEWPD